MHSTGFKNTADFSDMALVQDQKTEKNGSSLLQTSELPVTSESPPDSAPEVQGVTEPTRSHILYPDRGSYICNQFYFPDISLQEKVTDVVTSLFSYCLFICRSRRASLTTAPPKVMNGYDGIKLIYKIIFRKCYDPTTH